MEFPKLKLPPKGYSLSASRADARKAGCFAGKLRSAIYQYQENHSAYATYLNSDSKSQYAKKVCSSFNRYCDDMRSHVDREMQKYILEHDGVIDSWGDSGGKITKFIGDFRATFDYFGADYMVSNSLKAVRKSEKLVYRNAYRFPGTDAYNEAVRKKQQLDENIQKAKPAEGGFIAFLCLLGGLYLSFGALSILGDRLFHVGGLLDPLFENPALGTVLDFPYVLYSLIRAIFGEIESDKAVIVFSIILLGACLLGVLFCFSYCMTLRKRSEPWRQAKKERDDWMKRVDYEGLAAENERLRKLNEDLAEQWHRAWYDWICSVKNGPDQAQ